MFKLLHRLWAILTAKGHAAVSQIEEENIQQLLEAKIEAANADLSKAQAGVATAFSQVVLLNKQLEKETAEEAALTARFKVLYTRQAPSASDVGLQLTTKRDAIVGLKARIKAAQDAADLSQRTLDAARKAHEKNIREARSNASAIASNRALANALEAANGLVSESAGTAADFTRIANKTSELNAKQLGRIMAAQGQLTTNGLLDDAETTAILADDAAAKLAAEFNLTPNQTVTGPSNNDDKGGGDNRVLAS